MLMNSQDEHCFNLSDSDNQKDPFSSQLSPYLLERAWSYNMQIMWFISLPFN